MIPNYKKLIKEFGGKWVILNENSTKVLKSGRNAKKIYSDAKKEGCEIPKLFKVPRKYIPYIGYSL